MNKITLSARFYILSTILAGSFFLGERIWNANEIDHWLFTLVLTLLGALSLRFEVDGATNHTHYNISFLVYGFTLVLLGAPQAILVVLFSHLVELTWRKVAWFIQAFNLMSFIIIITAVDQMYGLFNPTRQVSTWQNAFSMFLAMALFTGLNHLMVGVYVWLAHGETFSKSGIFSFYPLLMDCVLLSMGAGAAVLWVFNPAATFLVLLPLFLVYKTLRVPALERQTETDQKTGVYNHQFFETSLQNELRRAERFNRPLTIVMADLDLLRNINNTYGHLAGDEVLIGVARILRENVREYDIVSRFGGEEFAILLPETTPEQAYPVVERIRGAIAKAQFNVPTSLTSIGATMSFGIAGREPGLSGKEIIHNADMALYQAKLKGRNRAFIFSREGSDCLFLTAPETAEPLLTPEQIGSYTSSVELPGFTANPAQSAPPTGQPHPHLHDTAWTQIYISCLAGCALGLFWLTLPLNQPVDWLGVALFALLVLAVEWSAVDIYARNSSVSSSAVPLIAGVLLFGPAGVMGLSLAVATAALIKHKGPFSRFIFNTSSHLAAGAVCLLLLEPAGLLYAAQPPALQALVSVVSALLIFLVTSLNVAVGMHLNLATPLQTLWKEQFSWLAPYYLGMGLIAFVLGYSYQVSGWLGAAVILVPLVLLRMGQKQFIDRTSAVVSELRLKSRLLETHNGEIKHINDNLLDMLAEVIDLRDPYVMGHSRQVTYYALLIARQMGLAGPQLELLRKASLMHDVGKLGIHETVLSKPTSLTPQEFEQVKRHVTVGANLLQKCEALQPLVPIVLHHHEAYDGTGYPEGLMGDAIPLEARIIGLANAIDALACDRPYRRGWAFEAILEEVQRCSGAQFDPQVVNAFLQVAEIKGSAILIGSIPGEYVSIDESNLRTFQPVVMLHYQ